MGDVVVPILMVCDTNQAETAATQLQHLADFELPGKVQAVSAIFVAQFRDGVVEVYCQKSCTVVGGGDLPVGTTDHDTSLSSKQLAPQPVHGPRFRISRSCGESCLSRACWMLPLARVLLSTTVVSRLQLYVIDCLHSKHLQVTSVTICSFKSNQPSSPTAIML